MSIVQARPATQKLPRVLVVDDEPFLIELFRDAVTASVSCQVIGAASVSEARRIIARQGIDLLVTDVILPDGNGMSLLSELHRFQPCAAALVVTGLPNVNLAIDAIRGGAVDFVPKPFSADQLIDRVRNALLSQRHRAQQELRMQKLRSGFKRLNAARRQISKKVDLLCNDLISAYGDLSREMDGVRIQHSYRQFLDRAVGLEQLLCHTMDWLLRQLGYSNIGIWLASSDQELQLGAYMKYTLAAESELVDAMQKNLLRMITRRGFVRLRQPEVKSHLIPAELKHLESQEILGISCTYLAEPLAVIVLCRDHKTPFNDDDITALKTISPLFAVSLAHAVRLGEGGDETEEDASSDDASGRQYEDPGPSEQPKPKRKDPADWWKNGEAPPF